MRKEAQADKQSQHLKSSPHLETLDDFAKTFLTLQTLLVRSNGNSCYSVPMDSEFSPSFPSNGSYTSFNWIPSCYTLVWERSILCIAWAFRRYARSPIKRVFRRFRLQRLHDEARSFKWPAADRSTRTPTPSNPLFPWKAIRFWK